jgi:thioredoxin:protein disulfide reductase
MRMRALLGLLGCLVLMAQKAPVIDPVKDVSVAFMKGEVIVQAPAGAHLKSAFMSVKLKEGTPGRLEVGPLPPTNAKDELGDGIWHGPVEIPVKGQDLKGDVELVVTYQPCTEGEGAICFPPKDRVLKVSAAELSGSPPARGLFWIFLGVFAAGVLASLTPCVYPMIPITMTIIGAKGGGKLRGFLLSVMLVLGMAVTYSVLGLVAARSHDAFGAFAQHPAFLIPVSILFAVFALSLFGAFEIRLPSRFQAWLQGDGSRSGFAGAFIMGLVLGPISAPCVGPVIGTVLLAISSGGSALLGALQLFTFALGMGVLFTIVGTFSASLPRSGEWLVKLKQAMGLVALGFAIWNLRFIVPVWLSYALWACELLVAAGVAGVFEPAKGLGQAFRKGLGFLALAVGLILGLRAIETGFGVEWLPRMGNSKPELPESWRRAWLDGDYESALARAKAEKKLVVVDVWAEWCAACKELDEKTWPDPALNAWIAQNAVAVRIDTFDKRKDLQKPLGILSYPTVLVLDGEGKELRRQLGFQKPEVMLDFLKGQ